MAAREEERIVDDMFEEWEEAMDPKGKKKRRKSEVFLGKVRMHRNAEAVSSGNDDSDVGATRRLMREVERMSQERERGELEMTKMREMEMRRANELREMEMRREQNMREERRRQRRRDTEEDYRREDIRFARKG